MLVSERRRRRGWLVAAELAAVVLLAACGSSGTKTTASSSAAPGAPTTTSPPTKIRLGYFPNITHAPAIVGVDKGLFAAALGQNTLETATFNAGPEAIEALFAESIDATFIGPNPAINAYAKSRGEAVRIVAGTTSGGAYLVVKPEITKVADLKGKTLSTPQLGNTQDVALRKYLKDNGLSFDGSGGGDVSITPLPNADTLSQFAAGTIDGAWVPEPFATRLQKESAAKVLVDEKTLWPDGKFVTTHLIVATRFLQAHPDVVEQLINGLDESIKFIESSPADAQKVVNEGINEVTGKPLKDTVLSTAFKNLTFTLDPVASSLKTSADNAEAVGLLDPVDLKGIYDLSLLNNVLKASGQAEVKGLA